MGARPVEGPAVQGKKLWAQAPPFQSSQVSVRLAGGYRHKIPRAGIRDYRVGLQFCLYPSPKQGQLLSTQRPKAQIPPQAFYSLVYLNLVPLGQSVSVDP